MTTDLKKLRNSLEAVRSYAAADDTDKPTADDQHEAAGLAMAAQNLADEYGNDPTNPDFLDHIDALHGTGAENEGRSYAAAIPAPRAGMQLVASKKNPHIRRWIRSNALKNVMQGVKTHAATSVATGAGAAVGFLGAGPVGAGGGATAAHMAVMGLHHAVRRQNGLATPKESALDASHYLNHHADFVAQQAKRHGVHEKTVAHALAYHALAEHHRQHREAAAGGTMGNGKPHPVANRDLTDREYHKNLSGRAKSAFIKGVIRNH